MTSLNSGYAGLQYCRAHNGLGLDNGDKKGQLDARLAVLCYMGCTAGILEPYWRREHYADTMLPNRSYFYSYVRCCTNHGTKTSVPTDNKE